MSYARRVLSLDGLRGIAAIVVMLFHFNIFFLPQARLPFVGRAYLAVDLFFLLSGFVMTHVYGHLLASNWRAHWPKFAIARFARIYPLFAVTTLVMIIVVALSNMPLIFVSFSVRSLLLQPLLLQQWASGLSWDYPSWSISTEAEYTRNPNARPRWTESSCIETNSMVAIGRERPCAPAWRGAGRRAGLEISIARRSRARRHRADA
jgi:peptidoglycan/LPS O-acetylase OafA/YrhL